MNSEGGFPIEIETKISKLITYSLAICNKLAYLCFYFDRKSTFYQIKAYGNGYSNGNKI